MNTTTQQDTQAAANKAAEEGGLPMTIGGKYNWKGQPERLAYLGRNWSGNGYWHQFEKVDAPGVIWCEVLDADLSSFEETKPIAADRASRQVANKAEVEPVGEAGTMPGTDGFTMACFKASDVPVGTKLYATSPATTGASTGWQKLNDVQWMNIVNHDRAYESYSKDDAVHEAVKRTEAKLKELNAGSVGASTVLTDERTAFEAWKARRFEAATYAGEDRYQEFGVTDQFRAFKGGGEVAAQAGQVAVPGWTSADDRQPEFRHECTSSGCKVSDSLMVYGQNEFGTTGCGFGHARDDGTWATYEAEYDQLTVVKVTHWMPLPAAPSPAKESK